MQAARSKTPFQRKLDQTDLTATELARHTGVNVSTIWRWRTGHSVPRSSAIRRAVAEALGSEAGELFCRRGDEDVADKA
jgi:transcriptional regulator with XRE-family HTH domain